MLYYITDDEDFFVFPIILVGLRAPQHVRYHFIDNNQQTWLTMLFNRMSPFLPFSSSVALFCNETL